RSVRLADPPAPPWPLYRARPASSPRDRLVAGLRGDLRGAGRHRRLGLAAARLDADLYRPRGMAAVVPAAVAAALSRRARHLVLLDSSPAAPARVVPRRPCRPSRESPADRLGGNELPSARGRDRRGGDPG